DKSRQTFVVRSKILAAIRQFMVARGFMEVETPMMVEGFTYIPHRFALGFAEAPRGDDIHWSMTGDN
ncbi:amino acid--tRNA ligase-related protein, partial [Escherichia coli]|uniref:amino acid--tRNA ligase-related protein n=1 Tax=Escherichia coli TaxID=562 RepID=UPI003EE13634